MIVSFPEDAEAATCCSMLLLILALSSYKVTLTSVSQTPICDCDRTLCKAALFTAAAFFGATYRLPFFMEEAALAACLEEFPFLFCSPFDAPCTILRVKDRLQTRDGNNSGERQNWAAMIRFRGFPVRARGRPSYV